jgi:hypothetical protein
VLRSCRWRLCLLVAARRAGPYPYPRVCGNVVCGWLGGYQLSYFIQRAIVSRAVNGTVGSGGPPD